MTTHVDLVFTSPPSEESEEPPEAPSGLTIEVSE